ncbi:MAG: hypothetical protein M4579_001618 [Chaenotheca gracillima]|nr:MAG: hypothetical protein M4579_001618 [Chaenotheca gracillima]
MNRLALILCGALIFLLAFRSILRWQDNRRFAAGHGCKEPRREKPYDVLGVAKVIDSARQIINKTALTSLTTLFTDYGDTFQSQILNQRVIFTRNTRNLRDILITNFGDYDNSTVRVHLFKPITEHGIFAVDGAAWRAARHVYRNQFSHTRSIVDLQMQENHIQNLINRIPADGSSVDLQPLFLHCMLDITTAFALGESADSLSPHQTADQKDFVDNLLHLKMIMARDGFLGPVSVIYGKADFHNSCSRVHRYVERIIARRLEQNRVRAQKEGGLAAASEKEAPTERDPRGYSILGGLTDNTDDMIELRDGVITILIAGIDSVASLLSSTFWLLSRDERVFQKLRTEVIDTVGHEPPTYDQIRSLTYLRYVFNEAMRVVPPVPINARTANKRTVLPVGGGQDGESPVFVNKGDRVIFSSYGSHRHFGSFGDDAHDFRPERWEALKAETLGFIPFNLGPRACPGQHYALAEASNIMVRLLQTFSTIKNRDPRPWVEHIGLNLSNENGVILQMNRE